MDKKMKNKKDSISIKFVKSKDYILSPASGVWGGFTPAGDFKIDFFIDYNTIPTEIMHKILSDGKLGDETGRKTESIVTRELVCGIILTAEQAKSIAEWMINKIKASEDYVKRGKK